MSNFEKGYSDGIACIKMCGYEKAMCEYEMGTDTDSDRWDYRYAQGFKKALDDLF